MGKVSRIVHSFRRISKQFLNKGKILFSSFRTHNIFI